jgi:hypothetical protein
LNFDGHDWSGPYEDVTGCDNCFDDSEDPHSDDSDSESEASDEDSDQDSDSGSDSSSDEPIIPVDCSGECPWQWVEHSGGGSWVLGLTECVSPCQCIEPPNPGAFDGDVAITDCVQPSGPCGGDCAWEWDGATWNTLGDSCNPGCVCDPPKRNGAFVGDVDTTVCIAGGN